MKEYIFMKEVDLVINDTLMINFCLYWGTGPAPAPIQRLQIIFWIFQFKMLFRHAPEKSSTDRAKNRNECCQRGSTGGKLSLVFAAVDLFYLFYFLALRLLRLRWAGGQHANQPPSTRIQMRRLRGNFWNRRYGPPLGLMRAEWPNRPFGAWPTSGSGTYRRCGPRSTTCTRPCPGLVDDEDLRTFLQCLHPSARFSGFVSHHDADYL